MPGESLLANFGIVGIEKPQVVNKATESSALSERSDFEFVFDANLTPHQIQGVLKAFADYFRALGGVGFEIQFEEQEAYAEDGVRV